MQKLKKIEKFCTYENFEFFFACKYKFLALDLIEWWSYFENKSDINA